jgi:DNA-binding IclR family transcriptional regulator
MPRPSPASIRIVGLLNFLADHPSESFRLSDIAHRLDFNKATAHGMLAVLTEAEYLAYDEGSKRFSLGPTVVNLAQAAVADDNKLATFALPEMERLAERSSTQVVANVVIGDEVTVIAEAGQPAGGRGTQVGYRARMVPPLGMVFNAWASEARVGIWLDRISADTRERARYATMLAAVRERGFSVAADQEARERLDTAVEQLADESVDREVRSTLEDLIEDIARGEHELVEIRPDRSYRTRQISAPVFAADGSVRLGLLLTGLPEIPGTQLLDYGRMVVESARIITGLIAGQKLPESAEQTTMADTAGPAKGRRRRAADKA